MNFRDCLFIISLILYILKLHENGCDLTVTGNATKLRSNGIKFWMGTKTFLCFRFTHSNKFPAIQILMGKRKQETDSTISTPLILVVSRIFWRL